MLKDINCGELNKSEVGKKVTLAGWVHRRRDHGGLLFIDLRDRSGLVQVVFNPELSPQMHQIAETLRNEWECADCSILHSSLTHNNCC